MRCYFYLVLGVKGVARSEGGDCEIFLSCGKTLPGRKVNYFNYRALLL